MTDAERQKFLLQERYVTVRSLVRDAYEKCQTMKMSIDKNDVSIKKLEDKKTIFNKRKIQKSIDKILEENSTIEVKRAELIEFLRPYAEELDKLEEQLGEDADKHYSREDNWWIRF